jgi:phosphoribosylformimino-5-aminoimidazole carboxamide ribotide isomerase
MRVIPVIDLLAGQVVRGIAGERDLYRPIVSRLTAGSHPGKIAQAFVEHFGLGAAYLADLDAIQYPGDDKPCFLDAYEQIARAGLSRLWLDAGIGTPAAARHVRSAVETRGLDVHFVVGLESLAPDRELVSIAAELSRERTIFSLDLRAGLPLTQVPRWCAADPVEIAYSVLASGISRLIVLDLADVGMQGGTGTLELCRRLRAELGSGFELIGGGGVRGNDDLRSLAQAGCDAALVASALHDERLTAADITAAERSIE